MYHFVSTLLPASFEGDVYKQAQSAMVGGYIYLPCVAKSQLLKEVI